MENPECPICFKPIINSFVITKCHHKFCIDCLFKQIVHKNSCPLCRKKVIKTSTLQTISTKVFEDIFNYESSLFINNNNELDFEEPNYYENEITTTPVHSPTTNPTPTHFFSLNNQSGGRVRQRNFLRQRNFRNLFSF